MSTAFNPKGDLIIIPCFLDGPAGTFRVTLAVDLGATRTVICPTALVGAGYNPALCGPPEWMMTAGGAAYAPCMTITYIRALGWQRRDMSIFAYQLPPLFFVDGLLGLDFFRDHVLTVDFHFGEIEMTAGPSASATP